MKKLILSVILLCSAVAAFACTNLIVGKKASADGSVMCTYNCDSFGFLMPLSYSAPGRHAPGEMISVRGGFGPGLRDFRAAAEEDGGSRRYLLIVEVSFFVFRRKTRSGTCKYCRMVVK